MFVGFVYHRWHTDAMLTRHNFLNVGGTMKLATFNLESFGSDRIDEAHLTRRIQALRPKLLELEADILCLQEVNAQKIKGAGHRVFHDLRCLIEGTPYAGYAQAHSERAPGKGPGDRHNLLVLSRFPIRCFESLYHTHCEPPVWRPVTAEPAFDTPQTITFERPVLKTEIDIGTARPLYVFNLHLRAPIAAQIPGTKTRDRTWKSLSAWAEGYHLSVLKRTTQALELRLAAEALFDADEAAQIILTGDFNATGDTGTLRLLRADPDDTASPALDSRRLYQLDASLPADKRKTVIHKGRAQTLDHVLASRSLTHRVIGVQVFNAALPDEVFDSDDPDYAGSYHAAMRVDFELTGT